MKKEKDLVAKANALQQEKAALVQKQQDEAAKAIEVVKAETKQSTSSEYENKMQSLQKEHQSNIEVVKQEYSKKEALAVQQATQTQSQKHQSDVESLKREFGTNQTKLQEEAKALRKRLEETEAAMKSEGAQKLQEESKKLETEFQAKLSEKEQALQAALTAGTERSNTISVLKDDLRVTQDKASDLTRALDAANLELQLLKNSRKKMEEEIAMPPPPTQQQEMTFSPPPTQEAPAPPPPAAAPAAVSPSQPQGGPASDKRASLINLDTPDKWDDMDDGQNPSPRPFFELN
jgi:hypothetical protein